MRRQTIFFALATIGLALVAISAWQGDTGMRDTSGPELFRTLAICAAAPLGAHALRKILTRRNGDGKE